MSGSTPVDLWNTADSSDTDESLVSFHTCLTKFADSHEFPLLKDDLEKRISEIKDWVEEMKKSSDEKAKKELVQNMGKFATSAVSGIQKMGSGDVLGGTLEMVSVYLGFVGEMVGGPIGAAVGAITGTICSIIGAIFAASKPHQPSFMEQVAEAVHRELVEFNSKLQNQKYEGLKLRVSNQSAQLQKMKRGEKLDDPNLWKDYVQFMGELGDRIQSPLPYKYENNLTKDPDVADFVKALMTYCQAFGCFNALLITAKGTFKRLGEEYKEADDQADREITGQRKYLEGTLSFLFDEKYLTFLGRLPSEGGKLTKIVAFSRNTEARSIVKMTTRGFGFPELPDYNTVESKAEIVSRQSVKLKLQGHYNIFEWDSNQRQFINETQFPMKVIEYKVSEDVKVFSENLKPRSSLFRGDVCSRGYVLIYLDGQVRLDDEPYTSDETHIIEFASDGGFSSKGINIQDKTCSELTRGQDTYDKINSQKNKQIDWKTKGVHYVASAECQTRVVSFYVNGLSSPPTTQCRFVFQDFDPFRDQDIVTAPKGYVTIHK